MPKLTLLDMTQDILSDMEIALMIHQIAYRLLVSLRVASMI
jgi:hypothetical protein